MWFKQYKWKSNPFDIKINTNLIGIGNEKSIALEYLRGKNIVFLTGESGTGKTSLLFWIKENLKKHKIFYINAEEINNNFSVDELLKDNKPFWRKYPKKAVILLDESQASNEELKKALKLHWEKDHIKSIMITQINENLNGFSESIKNRIGNRVIKLGKLTDQDVYELIYFRTNGRSPLSKDSIDKIAKYSNYIPRKVLENCERVCIYCRGKEFIDEYDVEGVLGERKIKQDLSPMQDKIIDLLIERAMSAQEIGEILGSSEGSVGKQLSKLGKTGKVKIVKETRPKEYGLVE